MVGDQRCAILPASQHSQPHVAGQVDLVDEHVHVAAAVGQGVTRQHHADLLRKQIELAACKFLEGSFLRAKLGLTPWE